jgi:hypothetical protein
MEEKKMVSTRALINEKLDELTIMTQKKQWDELTSITNDLGIYVILYYEKRNINKDKISKLIKDFEYEHQHHYNDYFRNKYCQKFLHDIRVQFKNDIYESTLEYTMKIINQDLMEGYSALRALNDLRDLNIIHEIFKELEELAPRFKNNYPNIFEIYEKIMKAKALCTAVLPILVQKPGITGRQILKKDDEKKIDEGFSELFGYINEFFHIYENSKIEIIEETELEILNVSTIDKDSKEAKKQLISAILNFKKMENIKKIYDNNPELREKLYNTFNEIKNDFPLLIKKIEQKSKKELLGHFKFDFNIDHSKALKDAEKLFGAYSRLHKRK